MQGSQTLESDQIYNTAVAVTVYFYKWLNCRNQSVCQSPEQILNHLFLPLKKCNFSHILVSPFMSGKLIQNFGASKNSNNNSSLLNDTPKFIILSFIDLHAVSRKEHGYLNYR